jgi:hypothetical protein
LAEISPLPFFPLKSKNTLRQRMANILSLPLFSQILIFPPNSVHWTISLLLLLSKAFALLGTITISHPPHIDIPLFLWIHIPLFLPIR